MPSQWPLGRQIAMSRLARAAALLLLAAPLAVATDALDEKVAKLALQAI